MILVIDLKTMQRLRKSKPQTHRQAYCLETPDDFTIYFDDSQWKFKTVVSKVEWLAFDKSDEKFNHFRELYLYDCLPIIGYESEVIIQETPEIEPEAQETDESAEVEIKAKKSKDLNTTSLVKNNESDLESVSSGAPE